ncbi:MAG: protease modulator HflC [Reichenbachiella sp.]
MKFIHKAILMTIVLAILGYNFCTVIINQGEIGVVLNFGKPVRFLMEPGLFFKLPDPLHSVTRIDSRLMMLQPRASEFLTKDKKNIIQESSICYKIIDPLLYLKTLQSPEALERRLTDMMYSHSGQLLGLSELSDLVNVDKEKMKLDAMNTALTKELKDETKQYGIHVENVFIKRISLPQQNKSAVYERMRAERDRIAKKYLAEGEEIALRIRAKADKESREIIASAQKESSILRGNAEAEAMRIYGETYPKNPDFYSFMKSLETYKTIFDENSVIILDEKSPILKTLFSGGK